MAFTFSLVAKDRIAVVTLQGVLDRAGAPELQRCTTELVESAPVAVVLSFQGVTNIKPEAYRAFAQLAKALKTARIHYRFACVERGIKQTLITDGLLSHPEAKDSLEAALKELVAEIATNPG